MEGGAGQSESEFVGESWVGSDATSHTVTDSAGFECTCLMALAVAVDDRTQFNARYREILSRKAEEYNLPTKRPVLKTFELRRHAAEWHYEEILADFVEELLQIDCISNIHVTITTLRRQTVPAYQNSSFAEYLGPSELEKEVSNYYNLISIWDYLDEYHDAPWGTTNVLLDDFEGKDNFPWRRIGIISNNLYVIPKGDHTYPLLSLADLTMDYLKESVSEWTREDVQDKLEGITPEDSAFVNSKSLKNNDDVARFAPLSRDNIKRHLHYPHPIIFVDTEDVDNDNIIDFDTYHNMCEYAYDTFGCVKFFNESQDRLVLRQGDFIVCLNDDTEKYEKYKRMNDDDGPEIIDVETAFERFS